MRLKPDRRNRATTTHSPNALNGPRRNVSRAGAITDTALDRRLKIANLTQSVVITCAVLVGGAWTVYSFVTLQSAEKAALETAALRKRVPALDVAVAASHKVGAFDVPSAPKGIGNRFDYLDITVSIKNNGNETEVLDMSMPSTGIRKISYLPGDMVFSGGRSVGYPLYTYPSYQISPGGEVDNTVALSILPGAKHEIRYLYRVVDVGIYEVSFNVPSKSQGNTYINTGAGTAVSSAQLIWRGSTMVAVDSVTHSTRKEASASFARTKLEMAKYRAKSQPQRK